MDIEQADATVSLVKLFWRPLRAELDFADPKQGATLDTPNLSWWHIPISIRDAGIFHKRHILRAEVWATRFLGKSRVGEGIALRWRTRDGPKYQLTLEWGEIYQVPFVWRDEKTGGIVITNDDAFQNHLKWRLGKTGFYKWDQIIHGPDEVKDLEWRIEVRRPAAKPWVSDCSYLISMPNPSDLNDLFHVSANR